VIGVKSPEKTAVNNSELLETKSQTADKLHSDPVFISVEQEPQFKGGMLGFYQFLALNLHYPDQMIRYNIQGKVIITLTVEKDGSLSDIKAVRDIGYGSAEEAIHVLRSSPKWQPGYQNGRPVRVRYTLPISFDLVKVRNSSDTISKVTFNYKPNAAVQNDDRDASPDTSRKFTLVLGNKFDFQSDPLYVLDGKEITGLNAVDPNTIKDVKILRHPPKDNAYVILYGAKALNGVVIIESKPSLFKPASDH